MEGKRERLTRELGGFRKERERLGGVMEKKEEILRKEMELEGTPKRE